MRYLSVCSGIEAATAAWHPLGWEPVAFSEIEKFPSAVLAHHYPDVPNWGDMTRFQEWPDATVDVLVGGTPCQSFSVAGLRKGLADPRGNLALTYLAIADRYRPEWLVWENVPGVLSADGGRAFGAILGGMAELGYGFAYRILDAQYVRTCRYPGAVPQRRRRVFVVAHLGDWRRAAAVLFDPESLSGNPPPGREAGEEATHSTTSGALERGAPGEVGREAEPAPALVPECAGTMKACKESGGWSNSADHAAAGYMVPECANPLTHRMHKGINTTLDERQTALPVAYSAMPMNSGKNYTVRPTDVAQPLTTVQAGNHNQGGDFIAQPVAFAENSRAEVRLCGGDGSVSAQLTTGGGKPGQGQPCVAFHNRQDPDISGDVTHPLGSMDNGMAVAYGFKRGQGDKAGSLGYDREVCPTLTGVESGTQNPPGIHAGMAVRRLTPRECERLQGFPEIQKRMVVNVWYSEHQKSDALAETKSRKSQKSVLSADENEPPQPARTAEQDSSTSHRSHEPPVLLNVLIDYERGQVQIRNAEKLIWSASIVEKPEKSPLPMPIDDFVQLIASAQCLLEKTPPAGRADSLSHKKHSSAQGNGSWCVSVSGDGIEAAVKDAANGTSRQAQSTTSTTSRSGQSSQNCEPNLETLCCSAVAAIAGFIPKTTRQANSYAVSVETVCGFTRIPWRNKPAEQCPDGPRYKALGNSFAVNVVEWLGQRIQMVSDLAPPA